MIFNAEALVNAGLYPAHLEGHFLIVNKHREILWQFQPADSLTKHQMSWTNHPNFVAYKSSVAGWTTGMTVMLPGYNPEPVHHSIIKLDPADSTLPYAQITAPLTSGKELIWLTGIQNISMKKFPVEGRVEAVAIWIDNGK